VRALAQKGLRIRAIARVLKVAHTTVLERIKRGMRGCAPARVDAAAVVRMAAAYAAEHVLNIPFA
jgi:transposase-like protein